MNEETSIIDIIKPLWIKRVEIIIVLPLTCAIIFFTVYLTKQIVNIEPTIYYHQDLEFHNKLEQKYLDNFINERFIDGIYKDNGLVSNDISKNIFILNSSSRYDVIKKNIYEDTEELIIRLNGIEDLTQTERDLWNHFLNLDSKYYQLVINDDNLTDIEAKKIILSIINRFNNYHQKNNTLNLNLMRKIGFDANNNSFLYLHNRLQEAVDLLNDNEKSFHNLETDSTELSYKASVLMSNIYSKDPYPYELSLKKMEQRIEQYKSLKANLSTLYRDFYISEKPKPSDNLGNQLTIDSITQLIDLGKDISELKNTVKLTDTIYEINMTINNLENKIFDVKSLKLLFELDDTLLSKEQIKNEIQELLSEINNNVGSIEKSKSELAVSVRGNTYLKSDYRKDFSVTLLTSLSTLIFALLYLPSVYLRSIYSSQLK